MDLASVNEFTYAYWIRIDVYNKNNSEANVG